MNAQTKKRRRGMPKGRIASAADVDELHEIVGDILPEQRDLLIEHLHKIQDSLGHIPARLLTALAETMRLSTAEVFEVATFYHHFDVIKEDETPPPNITVRVCDSVSCAMHGADHLASSLDTTLGDKVRIQRVPCVGRCDSAPIAVVGTRPISQATTELVQQALRDGATTDAIPSHAQGYDTYRRYGGYTLLQRLCDDKTGQLTEDVLTIMDNCGLRGLGGAGFPAGKKWRIVKGYKGPRMMAVNIDEGEPGTFKDRHYLESDPHRFLDGMLIAAKVVDVTDIYIYLRDEYAGCRALLERELQRLKNHPPCSTALPSIHLRRGAGAYICGEESAMIESIEGKRGMPRQRPPYIAEVGLFGKPTLEHNLETLYWVRQIVESGPDWFNAQGINDRQGLRSFSVSGRVNKPGVHIAPAGITMLELIDEYCGGMLDGHAFKAYFPGGASGGILPASLGNLPLDFDTLQPHGCFIGSAAIIVLSNQDSVREAALNAMQFFAHESCGQCTPCRVGTEKAVGLMQKDAWEENLLEDLCQTMEDASICGLGQAAPNPVRCAIKYFPEEF